MRLEQRLGTFDLVLLCLLTLLGASIPPCRHLVQRLGPIQIGNAILIEIDEPGGFYINKLIFYIIL